MFRDQGMLARRASMRTILSAKMAKGTSIQDHILKMMDSLNKLDVLGAEIAVESHIDIILESLPDSFNNFKINYNMNKMSLTLAELSTRLVAMECIIKKPSVLMIEKSFVKSKPKGKGQIGKKYGIKYWPI